MNKKEIDCKKCKNINKILCNTCSNLPRTCFFKPANKQVAIIGGAFNPVTISHLKIAEAVFNSNSVDEVWIMPCLKHRYGKDMSSFRHRITMLDNALELYNFSKEDNKRIKVSDFEWANQIEGGTYILLKALKEKYLDHDFSFIIGGDNAMTINKWANYEKLLEETRFFVFNRIFDPDILKDGIGRSWWTVEPHVLLNDKIPPFSSTQARDLIKHNRKDPYDEVALRKLLQIFPDGVYNYIMENKLYID